jgi:AAA+ ATPase superfamily predicted ATPase
MEYKSLLDKPKILCIVGDVNSGKSNLIYDIIKDLRKEGKFNLVTYGLRNEIPNSLTIYSVEELEQVRNSVIIIDELFSLWDLENRKIKRQIENSLRLINHNNNILILCAVPENVKKFLSGKVDAWLFKKSTISDFINGSKVKQIVVDYKGSERGTSILNLKKDEAILFDGNYHKINIPYHKEYDTKLKNVPIFVPKNEEKMCEEENCEITDEELNDYLNYYENV